MGWPIGIENALHEAFLKKLPGAPSKVTQEIFGWMKKSWRQFSSWSGKREDWWWFSL